MDGNGEHGVTHVPLDTVILTYDRSSDHLDVAGTCNSMDLMLDMLYRAKRAIEYRMKVQQAKDLQTELAKHAEAMRLTAALGKGR
jgi:hypothetical protein